MSSLIAVDLFSGCGGFRLGMERANIQTKLSIEIDKNHAETYKKNFPGSAVINDSVENVSAETIWKAVGTDKISIVFGGPPCQAFSMQGKRDESDPRRNLIWEFQRIVAELRADYFIFENVRGLLQGKMLPLFESYLKKFRELGYFLSYRLVNASWFGVPQHRERVIVVGCRHGKTLPKIPYPQEGRRLRSCIFDAIGDLPEIEDYPELIEGDVIAVSGVESEYVKNINRGWERPEFISGMQRTEHSQDVRDRFNATPPGGVEPISRFMRLKWDGISATLKAGTQGSTRHTATRPIHPQTPRCISVRESARIMGFPDAFTFADNKHTSLIQIGNSIPPLLAEEIGNSVVAVA